LGAELPGSGVDLGWCGSDLGLFGLVHWLFG